MMKNNSATDIFLNESKVAIFSDLHLGVHLDSTTWHQVAIDWCDWFIVELQQRKIQDIIFLGDFYHHRSDVSVSTLHVASVILEKLKDFNIIMIVGNHDSYYKQRSDINSLSILGGRNNIKILSETTVTRLFGRTCIFLPWSADISNLEDADIIFGHLEIESFKMNSFKTCDHGMKTQDLLKKSNLIMSGHFHLRDERKYDNGTIIYVGNPFEMDFGDTGSTKGIYILDIEKMKYDFVENNLSPKHKKISLTELTNTKNITSSDINQIINGNFVKFVVDKKANSEVIDTLIQKFSGYRPLSFTTDYTYTENNYNIDDKNYDTTGVDMEATIEEFVRVLDIENKESIIQYCSDLYKRASEI
jgi:DNA repair exonuclease SbcCD nuclease subunit